MYGLLCTVHTCAYFSHHHLECKLIKFTVSLWSHQEAPQTEWWQDECMKTCRLSYALLLQLTRDVRPCLSRQPQLSESLVLSGMATCWQPSISASAPSRRPPWGGRKTSVAAGRWPWSHLAKTRRAVTSEIPLWRGTRSGEFVCRLTIKVIGEEAAIVMLQIML